MWATACALAVLRRQPEHYDRLEKACALALAHVDSHVFECAKHAMPPVPLSIAPAGEAIESCFRKSSHSLYAVPEVQDVWAPAHVLYIHTTKPPLYDLQYDDGGREKVLRVNGRHLRRSGVTRLETSKSMLEHVTTRWLTPVPVQDEVERPPDTSTVLWITADTKRATASSSHAKSRGPAAYAAPRTLTPLEADVIASILRHEKVLASFLAKVDACSALYTSARIFGEKIHAFDAFTQLAPAVVESTLACIEHVVALQEVLAGPGVQHYVPFMWHGQPFLSTVLHQFDRLQGRHDLVDWYGVDFYFECNPFLMTTTVGCRKRLWSRDDVVQNGSWPETAYSPELRCAIAIGEEHLLKHWQRSEAVHSWV
ncbi:hypothetical protein SPRG_06601 [Saprolegnia parasitica CBS 223.65]|uniref:Uncharacterized protein n=1 Tax=Saprolegnia parasitica (strain CBS 223.65) TaxID=695850 RepID=A0A067CNG5_SAPPC|nr:hypothetical protein SPRG_06601 [Saprolegnia parasitica CBS 223.65]KDO28362.1 hypothetical protein SPRG_06601 [Saprolegnia parasitica CBS 223.65]|eukprot:XP_012200810.1 hypothetical protein SPRG_06601 [Saprolegnia parasitica CBS 223.65]